MQKHYYWVMHCWGEFSEMNCSCEKWVQKERRRSQWQQVEEKGEGKGHILGGDGSR